MLEVWPLLIHHLGQQLVLQTIPGHSEVDERGLGLNLWLVVRIGQLGVEDQSEAWVEETLLVPNLYTTVRQRYRGRKCKAQAERNQRWFVSCVYTCSHVCVSIPSLLDGVPSQQRVNNRVNGLLEVLYEHSVPCHDSLLYHIYIAGTTFKQ